MQNKKSAIDICTAFDKFFKAAKVAVDGNDIVYHRRHLVFAGNPELEKPVEPRFYVHESYAPAIFGSLKYDSIKRDFAEPKPFYNLSSTNGDSKTITAESTVTEHHVFRKHVTPLPPSLGLLDRARLLLSNISHPSRPFDYEASNAV